MNDFYSRALGRLDGGLVLDVATGEGGFAGLLAARLRSYERVVGIDTSMPALLAARDRDDIGERDLAQIDAERLALREAACDTVAIAFSMHHMKRPARVLTEMVRVLKPGGHLLIAEMHASARTVPQRTAVRIHQWAAAVDTALGIMHRSTFTRQQFVDWVKALPLDEVEFHDTYGTGANPFDSQYTAQVLGYIDEYLKRASKASNYLKLARRATQLCQRMSEDGIQPEPVLVVAARKRR